MAAVDKIEDQRKPEDFIGYRNRRNWQTRSAKYFNLINAGVVELADTLDLGSNGQPCRFKSCRPYQKKHPSGVLFLLYSPSAS